MKLFDVYPLINIEPVKAEGSYVFDKQGTRYLDLYGGHAVISIGHTHPYYVQKISDQLNKIAFYSNSVIISLQNELADKLVPFVVIRTMNCFFATVVQKPMKMR
jgi:acetylornithine/N-succinyldiaminopimelate aminotransferase